jgi:integrase
LKAARDHVAFAIADGGPRCRSRAQADQGIGLARRPANRLGEALRAPARTEARTNWPGEPRPNGYILAGDPDGTKPIRPDSLSDQLAEARGHSKVTLQDLRHYAATTMLDASVPYRTVADLLGNREVTLRLHYDGRTETGKRDAAKALRRTPS